MSYQLDPIYAAALKPLADALQKIPPFKPGEVLSFRRQSEALYRLIGQQLPVVDDVLAEDIAITGPDGNALRLRWLSKSGCHSGSAVVYVHGGGMVAADLDAYMPIISQYVHHSGVSMLAVDYTLAPEAQGSLPTEQVTHALEWLLAHHQQYDIDPARIAVMGDSGGGAIAASSVIMARDRGITLAKQILIYPMLDNLTPEVSADYAALLSISTAVNDVCWQARIGDSEGADNPYVVPARVTDASGLPDTYLDVGTLDLFMAENIRYIEKLLAAKVAVEFHLFSGVNHAFELLAPETPKARQAMALRLDALKSI